jgi:glycosyltransferase involved in cell wall biosynthesis
MSTNRKAWILANGTLDAPLLGPMIRVLEMARQAELAGLAVTVLLDEQKDRTRSGNLEIKPLTLDALKAIAPGDATIASAHLHPRFLKQLVKSGIAFDADLYCVTPYEHIELNHPFHPLRVFQSRRRSVRRFQLLLEHAERVYLSNPQQLNFLGGMLFSRGTAHACELAASLPKRCMILPMGCNPGTTPATHASPYPPELAGRPIFFWGGGIWSWFDTATLIEAFRLLSERGSDAALFFLTGANPSSIRAHDAPAERTRNAARQSGLAGKSIFFATTPVGPSELPGYLAHCHAGIMANPPRLESFGSWRTRLLDLIPHGKPLVTSGYDPLSQELQLAGACTMVPSEDPVALADAIQSLCDRQVARSMGEIMLQQQDRYAWSRIFAPWRERLNDPSSFSKAPAPLPVIDQALFFLGL